LTQDSKLTPAVPLEYFAGPGGVAIAYRMSHGAGPLIVFLPGYMSDMAGGKAGAIADWAVAHHQSCLLLDYSGCGQSEGDFSNGTLSRWRDEILALIDHVGGGDVVLVGSSMGGWLMLLVALALQDRVVGLVGVAAAPDFTRWGYDADQKAAIAADGVCYEANPYGPEPTPTWHAFFDDGNAQCLLDSNIAITAPVRLLHGQADADVPWQTALRLSDALQSDDVRISLIKDGDHRLSRKSDMRYCCKQSPNFSNMGLSLFNSDNIPPSSPRALFYRGYRTRPSRLRHHRRGR
jgi:pimeloyl-ACP methyl ester carboxylesterase